jgi:hypothetical protein
MSDIDGEKRKKRRKTNARRPESGRSRQRIAAGAAPERGLIDVTGACGASGTRRQGLFLFAGVDVRLPRSGLLTRSRRIRLDLLFLRLLGFPIAPLLAAGHVDLPKLAMQQWTS